jgi:hypothetical protein
VRNSLIIVLKLCNASSKLNGDVEASIKKTEELEDPTVSFRTTRRLLERYTNTQLRTLGSLKPNIKQAPKSPITKGERPAHYPYVHSAHT